MAKKKSEVDIGKGFKRIYFVIAGLWVAFVFFLWFAEFMGCYVHKSQEFANCWDYSVGREILILVFWAGLVYPFYYFFKWIGAGFKKK